MKTATTFSDYFAEIIVSINLFKRPENTTSLPNNLDITDSIVLKFQKDLENLERSLYFPSNRLR